MANLVLESKLYNLSTRGSGGTILNEDKNFKSHIEYNIPDMIVRDESIEFIQFSIPYAVIPVSFYTINENNCRLDIIEDSVNKSFVFPHGNYSASSFIKEFSNKLGSNYQLTLNGFNSIFTLTNLLNEFTFLKSSTLTAVIGFSTDLNSSLVNNVNTIVFPRCCNFLPLPRICIRSSELLGNNNMIGTNNKTSDLIVSVPNNSRPNGQIYYQNQTGVKSLYMGNHLSRLVISLTDDDGNFLNFNGISSFFVLQFDIYRQFIPKLSSFSNIVNMVNSYNPDSKTKSELK